MEFFCSYLVGIVVAFLVFMVRHHVPWNGLPSSGYGLGFIISYAIRQTPVIIFWPITLVVWAVRGFPAAPYDFRLAPEQARAQGKRS